MKYLVRTIRKPTFHSEVAAAHYGFLQNLRDGGVLEQGGPFTDRSGGAYVIKAPSFDEARNIAETDPLHIHDCSEVTVREWDSK